MCDVSLPLNETMAGKTAFCSIFAVLVCISTVSGLYFHIGETEKKCFIEEIPDETMVVGNYKVQVYDYSVKDYLPSAPGLGMFVEVRDPEHEIVLSRTYAAEGRFTFTSHLAGEHVVCLHSNSTAWFSSGQLRVHLDIQVGEHAVDYSQIQAKDKLSELQLRIRQLLDQVEQITKEQNYQRYREERFRQTSESTNQRVLWWSIAQTLILLLTGFWQMRHLKSFFEAKKLV
ncbi:transmembrane emp24 domain-containing protein eca-like isoform X2 [Mizuhopecten yessoensis]|nr:transmembrane emp24 domain-containing protein eca-like isoform X2 [Mizuhopecten yessoensis]